MKARAIGRDADRADGQCLGGERVHIGDLTRGCLALVCFVAHDPQPQRSVADVAGVVQTDALVLERLQVLVEGGERPLDAFVQRCRAHVLDALERVDDDGSVLGLARRERESAVPADDCRDALVRRWRERRIPQHLGVVVGMNVNETGHDVTARRVDDRRSAERARRSDRHDDVVDHADIGPVRAPHSGSVHDYPVRDHDIEHHQLRPPARCPEYVAYRTCRHHDRSRGAFAKLSFSGGGRTRRGRDRDLDRVVPS
ncbi:unannotated protein [freshwater metagenome]